MKILIIKRAKTTMKKNLVNAGLFIVGSILFYLLGGILLIIITDIVIPLLYLIIAFFGIISFTALGFICIGAFTCPAESTFKSWMKSAVLNLIKIDKNFNELGKVSGYITKKIAEYKITEELLGKQIIQYFDLGFCRLVITTNPDTKQTIKYIGYCHTWFPFPF